jgi:hypothetical protein
MVNNLAPGAHEYVTRWLIKFVNHLIGGTSDWVKLARSTKKAHCKENEERIKHYLVFIEQIRIMLIIVTTVQVAGLHDLTDVDVLEA